jgi:hypothetical protein
MGRAADILHIAYSILKITGSLLSAWLLIRWKVREARRSFEAEMMKAGISKKDAQKISECFVIFRNQMSSLAKKAFSLERRVRRR